MATVSLRKLIGQGYDEFMKFEGRYLVCKGSRGSKKSVTASCKVLLHIMKYPLSNALVIRQVFMTHRDSTFAELKRSAQRLGVYHLFDFSVSPLQITYRKTGQKILFRGLDDAMSVTSIAVPNGFLNIVWVEEAYQVSKEDDFNKIDMSIRGELPEGYFKQFIITFNPWQSSHWLKKRFFDTPNDDNKLAMTTNYLVNEFLGEDDIRIFEDMKRANPRRYSIEGLGEWGVAEGLIFYNWEVKDIEEETIENLPRHHGLDFGFVDPNGLILTAFDEKKGIIYIYDEFYKGGMTNREIYDVLVQKQVHKSTIVCDSACPKDINELRMLGARRVTASVKGKDSILNGIKKLQEYRIVIDPSCVNTIMEFSNYAWDTKGKTSDVLQEKPIDDFCHLIDALRYAYGKVGKDKAKVHNRSKLF